MKINLSGHYGYGRIIRTMIPMVLMMMVISVYSIVDGFFVSNYAGSTAFAGMNLIWPAIALVSALGLMIGSGGSALVSKTFGEGNPEKANRIFSMLVRLTIIGGAAIALVFFVLMPQIVEMLGSDADMKPYAVLYGRIIVLVLPSYMLQMEFQPFYMVAEKPQMGTALSMVSGVSNIVLDALFVALLGWGLTGAAISSAVSMLISGIYPLWFFSSKKNATQLRLVPAANDWRNIAKSCTNGLSEFVGNVALSLISICYNLQLMIYIGDDGVSAYGIVMYVGFVFAAVFIGYNIGISQLISFNYGAGNKEEMRSLLRKSLVIISLAGILMCVVAEIFSPYIARLFVGYDQALMDLTVHALKIYMLSYLICGLNMFTSAWFTALNNGIVSAFAAFARTLVFELTAVFVLPVFFEIEGIWVSVNVAEILALFLSAILILSFRKKYLY